MQPFYRIVIVLIVISNHPLTSQDTTVYRIPLDLARNIHVDRNYKGGDWSPVIEAVQNKNMVLLGEMNHGAREIFITRNELIKALHQELGFDVILFESGIGELGSIQYSRDSLTSKQMTYGFFGGWRTQAFEDLMHYVRDEDITIGGFDVQKTGNGFTGLLERYAQQYDLEVSLYMDIEHRFNQQKRKLTDRRAVFDSVRQSTLTLINDYEMLFMKFAEESPDEFWNALPLIRRTIENRIAYLRYFLQFTKDRNWQQRFMTRDSMMAANVDWLIKHYFIDRKVLVVAHNYHIAKYNENAAVMGEFLKSKYGQIMYVLGVYAGSGHYADNAGRKKIMSPPDKTGLDIKKVILALDGRVHFIPIPEYSSSQTDFLFRDVIVNDSFIDVNGTNHLIPSRHFDGLLFIDQISSPVK